MMAQQYDFSREPGKGSLPRVQDQFKTRKSGARVAATLLTDPGQNRDFWFDNSDGHPRRMFDIQIARTQKGADQGGEFTAVMATGKIREDHPEGLKPLYEELNRREPGIWVHQNLGAWEHVKMAGSTPTSLSLADIKKIFIQVYGRKDLVARTPRTGQATRPTRGTKRPVKSGGKVLRTERPVRGRKAQVKRPAPKVVAKTHTNGGVPLRISNHQSFVAGGLTFRVHSVSQDTKLDPTEDELGEDGIDVVLYARDTDRNNEKDIIVWFKPVTNWFGLDTLVTLLAERSGKPWCNYNRSNSTKDGGLVWCQAELTIKASTVCDLIAKTTGLRRG
ncbi:MAG: hypothetical protein ABIG66_00795 [Candidatus Kerfeldbacteria bacterium]